jgi:acetylglutamate/LysW-gamma-L-alpha-aminoadipate kinase
LEEKVIVVKVGGGKGLSIGAVCSDIAKLAKLGQEIVLIHGGSSEIDLISERLGHPPRFVTSESGYISRYTDRETLEILVMVMAGRVNKFFVERLQALGVNALGLCGLDGRLLVARRKQTLRILEHGKIKVLRGDLSGRVSEVNVALLRLLLDAGYLPVVASVAVAQEGIPLNVDADRAGAAIAVALRADTLVFLTNVPGLLRDISDASSLIPSIPIGEAKECLVHFAKGRMKKKILAAMEAVSGRVGRAIIADGRAAQPVQKAIAGQGTVIGSQHAGVK